MRKRKAIGIFLMGVAIALILFATAEVLRVLLGYREVLSLLSANLVLFIVAGVVSFSVILIAIRRETMRRERTEKREKKSSVGRILIVIGILSFITLIAFANIRIPTLTEEYKVIEEWKKSVGGERWIGRSRELQDIYNKMQYAYYSSVFETVAFILLFLAVGIGTITIARSLRQIESRLEEKLQQV